MRCIVISSKQLPAEVLINLQIGFNKSCADLIFGLMVEVIIMPSHKKIKPSTCLCRQFRSFFNCQVGCMNVLLNYVSYQCLKISVEVKEL